MRGMETRVSNGTQTPASYTLTSFKIYSKSGCATLIYQRHICGLHPFALRQMNAAIRQSIVLEFQIQLIFTGSQAILAKAIKLQLISLCPEFVRISRRLQSR